MPAATSQELRPRRGVHSFTALVPTTLSPGTSRYGPSTVAMYTKHQISISRALIPTAGRILRNRQPASSSAFNAAAAQGVRRVFNQTPVPLLPKRRPCISNLPAEDPLALCEVDRDNASLALPRRSTGGVAVTSPHYTVNVSPAPCNGENRLELESILSSVEQKSRLAYLQALPATRTLHNSNNNNNKEA